MPISISRLRRWFAGAAIFVCIAVLGTYFYAKHRVTNALKQVPGKIGFEIQQSAHGFTISKSDQGRTLFKLQASKAVQFKQGGRAELHDVTITIYGRGSSRFDQVYGQDFEYDQQSGNVTSNGEVSIDLQANPQGMLSPDQTPPKELKNPLHLKTTGLVFNQKTGDAWTPAQIDFRVPQASGSAVGAKYVASDGVLILESQVRIAVNSAEASTILAEQATLQKAPREIVLKQARAESGAERGQADEVTLFLRDDNTLDRTVASGNVQIETAQSASSAVGPRSSGKAISLKDRQPSALSEVSAQELEIKMKPRSLVENAVLSGDVHFQSDGPQQMDARAGRAVLSFDGRNTITKVHAEQQVKLAQRTTSTSQTGSALDGRGRPSPRKGTPQDFEATAPAMDFFVSAGNRLTRAETIGAPQISLHSTTGQGGDSTLITADKFTAKFDSRGQLSQVHGEPNARVVSNAPPQNNVPQPDRITTSDSLDAAFIPETGIESVIQKGHFKYVSGTQNAVAETAKYVPANDLLTLTGSPRATDSGMMTTADVVLLNRLTGQMLAKDHVKTTYNDLKPQSGGALLASSDPIHVTAQEMIAHGNPSTATYSGGARLWQNANVLDAPSIQFEKEQRTVIAEATAKQQVSMVLVGTDKNGKATPVNVTANRMTYRDSERKAHLEGGVTARGADLTITSNQMDVFLAAETSVGGRATPPVQGSGIQAMDAAPISSQAKKGETAVAAQPEGLSKLDKIIASGSVLITEPNRRATGDLLTYTASDDKFVLTGGPPSIFDAEHGKITGVSLTLYRHDDRVVVNGDSRSPAVTQTRVVR
jgi:lipopolysaccharide export system protein LptA